MTFNNTTTQPAVAIIGAGVTGLTLALALHNVGLSCIVYEGAQKDTPTPGTLILSPNGIQVYSRLGLWSELQPLGYSFDCVNILDNDTAVDSFYYGHEGIYGSHASRIMRTTLLEVMRDALEKRGVPIVYSRRFEGIVQEDTHSVAFALSDSSLPTGNSRTNGVHQETETLQTYSSAPMVFSATCEHT